MPAHVAHPAGISGPGGRNKGLHGGECRQWKLPAEYEAKTKCGRCHLVGNVARNCPAPRPVRAPKQSVPATNANIDSASWKDEDAVIVEQPTACHVIFTAYNCQHMCTRDSIADSGAGRHMTNESRVFIATNALDDPTQVAYGDGHLVPSVSTGSGRSPVALGNVVLSWVIADTQSMNRYPMADSKNICIPQENAEHCLQ